MGSACVRVCSVGGMWGCVVWGMHRLVHAVWYMWGCVVWGVYVWQWGSNRLLQCNYRPVSMPSPQQLSLGSTWLPSVLHRREDTPLPSGWHPVEGRRITIWRAWSHDLGSAITWPREHYHMLQGAWMTCGVSTWMSNCGHTPRWRWISPICYNK